MKFFTKKSLRFAMLLCMTVFLTLAGKQDAKAATEYDAGTLSGKGSVVVTNAVPGEFDYIRFVASKDGYVTFTATNTPENAGTVYRGQWFLCNSAKKVLSSEDDCGFYDGYNITFAIKKNAVYYLKTSTYAQKDYQIDYTYKSVKEKSGSKRSKAVTIKKNKTVTGLLMAGEKKADWYKVKLTKKQALKITVSTKSYRGIQMQVYDKKGNEIIGLKLFQPSSTTETVKLVSKQSSYNDSAKKLAKGTYYIKVYCQSGVKGCGYYSLKWK